MRLIALMLAISSGHSPISFAQSGNSLSSPSEESYQARFERLKKEIGQLIDDLRQSQKNIQSLKETNQCIDSVYQSLSGLTEQLQLLGRREDQNSFAYRSGSLVAKHNAFFNSLGEFSKTTLTLVQNPDGTTIVDKRQLAELIERIPQSIRQLRNEFENNAAEEESYLKGLSLQLFKLEKAISKVNNNKSNIQNCTPQFAETAQKLIREGADASASLSTSRKLFADLQNKRARVLGAFHFAMKQKIASALAQASGQTADALTGKINTLLEELRLRSEVERWWFREALQNGPARGLLLGRNSDPLRAEQNLRLAIAGCDFLLSQVQIHKSTLSPADQNSSSAAISQLEQSLYQRRSALTQWLNQVNHSLASVSK
jgi:hypothetical protein